MYHFTAKWVKSKPTKAFLGFLATVDKVKPPARTPAIPTDPHTTHQTERHTLKRTDLMPWNDPHTAAPSLRAWQDVEGFAYECSAAPSGASTNGRRGMESFLLYRYRQERGESTLAQLRAVSPTVKSL